MKRRSVGGQRRDEGFSEHLRVADHQSRESNDGMEFWKGRGSLDNVQGGKEY